MKRSNGLLINSIVSLFTGTVITAVMVLLIVAAVPTV